MPPAAKKLKSINWNLEPPALIHHPTPSWPTPLGPICKYLESPQWKNCISVQIIWENCDFFLGPLYQPFQDATRRTFPKGFNLGLEQAHQYQFPHGLHGWDEACQILAFLQALHDNIELYYNDNRYGYGYAPLKRQLISRVGECREAMEYFCSHIGNKYSFRAAPGAGGDLAMEDYHRQDIFECYFNVIPGNLRMLKDFGRFLNEKKSKEERRADIVYDPADDVVEEMEVDEPVVERVAYIDPRLDPRATPPPPPVPPKLPAVALVLSSTKRKKKMLQTRRKRASSDA